MADAITKFLAKLSKKEFDIVFAILQKIKSGNLAGLQTKKLTGHKYVLRVRKGDFRFIYRKIDDNYIVISIDRRDESTYRDF